MAEGSTVLVPSTILVTGDDDLSRKSRKSTGGKSETSQDSISGLGDVIGHEEKTELKKFLHGSKAKRSVSKLVKLALVTLPPLLGLIFVS